MLETLGSIGSAVLHNLDLAERLRWLADTDALTGLANRQKAQSVLEHLYALACRAGKPLSVAILDIDFFKSVNDRFGHAVGDDVLRGIGPLLGGAFRAEDIVSRWGGEEFLVGLYGCSREDAIARVEAATARARARRFTTPDGTPFEVTFSAGVATYPTDALDLSALIQAADEALYRAKAIGRDRVLPATPLQSPVGAHHLESLSGAR
jgi:diguanylate cyclase (GGDEF)-like protein